MSVPEGLYEKKVHVEKDEVELFFNPEVVEKIDVIEGYENLYVSIRIKTKEFPGTIYNDTFPKIFHKNGLAFMWNMTTKFLWIDLREGTLVLHVSIPMLLNGADKALLGLIN